MSRGELPRVDAAPVLGYASDPSSAWDSGILWTLMIACALMVLNVANWVLGWAANIEEYSQAVMRGYYGLGQYIHILFSIVLPVLHLLLVVHILMALARKQISRPLRILCLLAVVITWAGCTIESLNGLVLPFDSIDLAGMGGAQEFPDVLGTGARLSFVPATVMLLSLSNGKPPASRGRKLAWLLMATAICATVRPILEWTTDLTRPWICAASGLFAILHGQIISGAAQLTGSIMGLAWVGVLVMTAIAMFRGFRYMTWLWAAVSLLLIATVLCVSNSALGYAASAAGFPIAPPFGAGFDMQFPRHTPLLHQMQFVVDICGRLLALLAFPLIMRMILQRPEVVAWMTRRKTESNLQTAAIPP